MAMFWCGVFVTLAAEFVGLIILAALSVKKRR